MTLDAQTTFTESNSTRRGRYKAEIASVSPMSSRSTFEQHDTCFLGVSLENANFTPAKLRSMVKWISRRFSHCTVLVGDSIHRITLESAGSITPGDAQLRALELGREFIEDMSEIFDEYCDSTDFTYLKCSEVADSQEFSKFHTELRSFFSENESFKSSVESFGRAYHGKHSREVSKAEWEKRIKMSSDYFLEEFAIFACLQQQGIPVMIYPGSFSTLSEIAGGEHPMAPQELRDLIVVSLHLKGRGS